MFMWIYIVLLFATSLKSLYRFQNSKKYLMLHHQEVMKQHKKNHNKINVIIPVLEEVHLIAPSIKHFMELEKYCNVYYVTTSREARRETFYEIKKQILRYNAHHINVLNSPNLVGNMATQLNFAINNLEDDATIGIYNIDSFPDEKVFIYVSNNIDRYSVMQQVSYFDDNVSGILGSAQAWQNRWSIVYELGKYLGTSQKEGGFIYTIGHGFFVRKNILTTYGAWDDSFINEDNELGYRLLCFHQRIHPIPYLEKSGFVSRCSIYIKQQSVWFNGPLYAFSYWQKHDKTYHNFILALLNFKAALSWLGFPIVTFIYLLLAIVNHNSLQLICIVSGLYFYVSFCNRLVVRFLHSLGYISDGRKHNIISDFFFFLMHSIGPMLTCYKILLQKNTLSNKYKTEK